MNLIRLDNITYLNFLLCIFKIFGLATFSIEKEEEKSNSATELHFVGSIIAVVYNLILIVIIATMNYITITVTLMWDYKQNLTLFNITDVFEVLFGTFVAIMILSFYCLNQQASIRLTAKVYKVKLITNQMEIGCKEKSSFYVASFIIFHLLMSIVLLVSGIVYFNYHVHLVSSACRNFVITWLILQYASVVRFLMNMFEGINEALRDLVKTPSLKIHSQKGNNSSVLLSTNKLRFLSSLRDLHYLVLEICHEVIKFYELIILGCIAYIFVCLVVFSYFLIDPILERRTHFSVIEYSHFLLWLISFTTAFVTLSKYVTKTNSEIDKTGIIIHQLIRSTLNKDILKELKNFSMYLLHIRLKFTAWGFFSLDGSLVQSIFSSITTYLVILVQFQLGSSKQSKINSNNIYNNTHINIS